MIDAAFGSPFDEIGKLIIAAGLEDSSGMRRAVQTEVIEVYVKYDRPLLFACRDAVGQLYLAVLVEEKDDSEVWVYVAMSERRLELVRSGGIDLYTAFKKPETGYIYTLSIPYSTYEPEISIKDENFLTDGWLPSKSARLNLETATIKQIES